MLSQSQLHVGNLVDETTQVGVMGATGNVTGVHLHLEYATSPIWNYDTFLNPATALGIPNERGTIIHYGATPPPPPPTITEKKKFPWPIYFNKLRNKRTF